MEEKRTALTREEVKNVIEGKGAARRVPMMIHAWADPRAFGEREEEYKKLLDEYPTDVEFLWMNMPQPFDAPADDPNYRWLNKDNPFPEGTAYDAVSAIEDWDEIDEIIEHFPSPDYPGLISKEVPPKGEKYRVGQWFYWMFERLWSLRGMENSLCDFYESPEAVHKLFRALTDFYKRAITRAHEEWDVDAIWTSDDIGTQTGPFFSLEIFREFFKPYYKELIAHTHSLGMHFWMHTCGNIMPFIPDFIEIGLDVLHPIQKYTMDEKEVAEKFGDKICLWGGFDVQQTIPYGTPEDVRREVRFMMDTYYRKDGRFMITCGNGLTPDTPFESLKALLDESYNYGTRLSLDEA